MQKSMDYIRWIALRNDIIVTGNTGDEICTNWTVLSCLNVLKKYNHTNRCITLYYITSPHLERLKKAYGFNANAQSQAPLQPPVSNSYACIAFAPPPVIASIVQLPPPTN